MSETFAPKGSYSVRLSVPVVCSDTDSIDTGSLKTLGPTRALLVKTAGDYKVTYPGGETDTVNLAAGIWHPMSVVQVWSTGSASTTAVSAGY